MWYTVTAKKMLKEITTVLVLLHLRLLVTAQECTSGEVRSVSLDSDHSDGVRPFPQYCYNGEWRMFRRGNGVYNSEATFQVICRHLGYSDQGFMSGRANATTPTVDFVRPAMACDGTEERIEECGGLVSLGTSGNAGQAWVECQSDCTSGEIRLVGGNNRRGRVEVCVDGRWGTVCNNQEGLARAVCAQAGFVAEGSQEMSFGPGFVPIHNCTIQNGNFSCTQITDASCDHTMDLGVVCRTLEELYNECLSTEAPTACVTDDDFQQSPAIGATARLYAVIGVMAILMLIMAVGWIATCVILRRKSTGVSTSKQKPEGMTESGTDQRQLHNSIYGDSQNSTLPGSQQLTTMATTESRFKILTGDEVTYDVANVPGHVYSVVDNRQAAVTNQGGPYNVLVHDHGNQPPVNYPQEQYSKLEL